MHPLAYARGSVTLAESMRLLPSRDRQGAVSSEIPKTFKHPRSAWQAPLRAPSRAASCAGLRRLPGESPEHPPERGQRTFARRGRATCARESCPPRPVPGAARLRGIGTLSHTLSPRGLPPGEVTVAISQPNVRVAREPDHDLVVLAVRIERLCIET